MDSLKSSTGPVKKGTTFCVHQCQRHGRRHSTTPTKRNQFLSFCKGQTSDWYVQIINYTIYIQFPTSSYESNSIVVQQAKRKQTYFAFSITRLITSLVQTRRNLRTKPLNGNGRKWSPVQLLLVENLNLLQQSKTTCQFLKLPIECINRELN